MYTYFKDKLLLLIVIIGTSGLFVGCLHQYTSTDTMGEKKAIEIEFWYGLSGYHEELMEEFIKEFNQQQQEVFVKGLAQSSYEETGQALQAAIARRKAPAVVLLEDTQMHRIGAVGGLTDLNGLIDEDSQFNISDFIPSFIEQGEINGKMYALPIFGTTQVLYYRKDIFENEGLTVSELNTWESLAEAARRLTKRIGNETLVYGWLPMQGRENLIDATISRGGRFLSEDGTQVMIDSEEWIETWETFRKWIHEEKIMKVHYGGEGWAYWYATIDDVMQGRAAGYTGSSGDRGDLDFSIIGIYPQPVWEGYEDYPRAVANAHAISIPSIVSQEEKRAAFQWMKFITSPENTARWSMKTGYIPVRKSAMEISEYQEFIKINPEFNIPYQQAGMATNIFYDPTGGRIYEALKIAAEKVQIQNISAEKALREAKKIAQEELDKVLK
ncbi:ABC transporter substrate-binding protein [Alkaliphilus peptidifermentans]|uniref:Multiple sugar transport system substrate-binding protein n=1 Tax=Alkaliphilus peptidifermentans DSM 18978 TaxID=1120976 RepID=A0A1G5JMQ2_9FIRM|nr:ABC transporter substrate-binding protein [Alkaliphilus peptidifermentans]SCY89675.1 multiple sugar transport system substrate-binding protein [Alkaliphilus peptidifermentans DSM 18978]